MAVNIPPARCAWAAREPSITYHDTEWGVPLHDDRALFELLSLEGAQAGLSWETVLKRREGYRRAFAGFHARVVADWGAHDIERLLGDAGIIRHRGKIASVITNARAVLELQRTFGSLDAYLWAFVDGAPLRNAWASIEEVPARTPLSDALSKDLKRRGVTFAGTTICYAFMQAAGLVNDHTTGCFRYAALEA